jgi:hypothetical protein
MNKQNTYIFKKEDEGHYFIRYDPFYGTMLTYIVVVSENWMVYAIWDRYRPDPHEWVYVLLLTDSAINNNSIHPASPLEELLLCPSTSPRIEATSEEIEKIKHLEESNVGHERYKKFRKNLTEKKIQGTINKDEQAILRALDRHEFRVPIRLIKHIKTTGKLGGFQR